MKRITATDVLSLSIKERIKLVEDIWDTIAESPEAVSLTDSEKITIDERLEAYHKNPNAGSPWEEVASRLQAK